MLIQNLEAFVRSFMRMKGNESPCMNCLQNVHTEDHFCRRSSMKVVYSDPDERQLFTNHVK